MTTSKLLVLSWLFLALSTALSAGEIGGIDVRIGAAQGDIDARSAILDFDPDSGNFYAVVEWDEGWTFNISTDGGATWNRRYRYTCGQAMAALDMAASGAWVYVGYTCSMPDQVVLAKMRRFALDTGDLDTGYTNGGELVADTSLASVVDIAVETNVDSDDDRIFYSLIQSDGMTRAFWDVPTDGTDFIEVNLNVSNAQNGLDMNWNPGFDTYSVFLSLVDQDGDIQVWRYDGSWSLATSFPYSGSQPRSAVSAFADQVVVAYLAPATHGQGVQYRQSSDGGTTWSPGTLIAAPSAGQGDFLDVDVTARGGFGLAVVYNLEAGDMDRSLFQYKPDYDPGPWTGARSFSDFDPVMGLPIALNWTPSDRYGVIYVGDADAIPYFDLFEPDAVFLDGFESGNSSAWSNTVP